MERILEFERKVFSAPYNWLIKKGIVAVMEVSERIYMTMEDLYESRFSDEYKGNPNFPRSPNAFGCNLI